VHIRQTLGPRFAYAAPLTILNGSDDKDTYIIHTRSFNLLT